MIIIADPTDPVRALRALRWRRQAGLLSEAEYWQAYHALHSDIDAQAAPSLCEYTWNGRRCTAQALAWFDAHAYCAHHYAVVRGGKA